MIIADGNEILKDTDGKFLSYTYPDVEPDERYFYYVEPGATRPTGATVDFGIMTEVEETSIVNELSIPFPETVGWLIFAESIVSPLRTQWYISESNQGVIGGSHEDFDPNLFPAPIQVQYQGKWYNVYISSYITLVSDPVIFKA